MILLYAAGRFDKIGVGRGCGGMSFNRIVNRIYLVSGKGNQAHNVH